MIDFATVQDRSPATDISERLHIVWATLGAAKYPHAYPADHVNKFRHLCQGQYLSKLRDPLTGSGKHALPLYTPAQVKTLLAEQRHADPVCPSCYGVLYWMFGEAARTSVMGYRLLRRNQHVGGQP